MSGSLADITAKDFDKIASSEQIYSALYSLAI